MMPVRSDAAAELTGAAPRDTQDAQLRRAAKELEGVFVAELFKAMRRTVPEGGLTGGGSGEEMFTSMLDQHLAPLAGGSWSRGVGESLYRQLRGAVGNAAPEETGG